MTSLRKTVMTYVTVLLIAVGLIAGACAYTFVKLEVNSFQDNALHEVAMTAGLLFRADIEPSVDAELEDQLVVQVWDRSGAPIHHAGPSIDIPRQSELGYSDVTADGMRFRVFRSRDAQHEIQVSQRWSAREEVAAYAVAGATLPWLVAIPLAWLLIRRVVDRVLGGLTSLSAEIALRSIEAKDLLDMTTVPVEVTPLVTAMNALIERHQRALETQRRFVSDAAHELRTPLAALQIQVDNLRRQELSENLGDIAEDLRDGVRRAAYSVNQLMTMVRAEAALESDPETVDARAFLEFTVAGFVPVARAKDVRLVVSTDLDSEITTRAADLRLVVANVIDNAVRYTPQGGEVIVNARRSDDWMEIEITDTGPGISSGALPRIYDRFFRAVSDESDGTGLGLSIAKVAAERSGIGLQIANRTDRTGIQAIVTIQLPSHARTELRAA